MRVKTQAIYSIENLLTGRRYIGSSVHVEMRFSRHRMLLNRGTHENKHLQAAWTLYGPDTFRFTVVELVANRSDLVAREQAAFDAFRPNVYNFGTVVDRPSLGITRTEEHKRKIGLANKGRQFTDEMRRALTERNHRPCTEAAKKKLSEGSKGRVFSAEHRANISAGLKASTKPRRFPLKGTKHSPEMIEKLKAAHRELWSKRTPEQREQYRLRMVAFNAQRAAAKAS